MQWVSLKAFPQVFSVDFGDPAQLNVIGARIKAVVR